MFRGWQFVMKSPKIQLKHDDEEIRQTDNKAKKKNEMTLWQKERHETDEFISWMYIFFF